MNHLSTFRKYTTTYPVRSFHSIVISLSWILLTSLVLNKLPVELGIIALTFVGLLGVSVMITYWTKGKPGIKKLFGETFRWRVNIGHYLVALFALPLFTIATSMFLGTMVLTPQDSLAIFQNYVTSLLSGFFIINLWEETGWTGFVQSKLMNDKGILKGSLLTAPGFVAVHIPLYLTQPSMFEFITSIAILIVLAFFFRYLLGMVYIDSNKSLFIVGLLHASFNNSAFGRSEMLPASIMGTVLFTLIYVLYREKIKPSFQKQSII